MRSVREYDVVNATDDKNHLSSPTGSCAKLVTQYNEEKEKAKVSFQDESAASPEKITGNRQRPLQTEQKTGQPQKNRSPGQSDSTSTLRSWPQAYHQDYFVPHPGHMQGNKSLAHSVNGQMDGMSTITSGSASQANKLPAPKKRWPWSWIAYYFGAILVFLNPPFGIIGLSGLAIAYIDHRARDYAGSHKKWIIAIAFIITGYVLLILAGGVILIYFIAR